MFSVCPLLPCYWLLQKTAKQMAETLYPITPGPEVAGNLSARIHRPPSGRVWEKHVCVVIGVGGNQRRGGEKGWQARGYPHKGGQVWARKKRLIVTVAWPVPRVPGFAPLLQVTHVNRERTRFSQTGIMSVGTATQASLSFLFDLAREDIVPAFVVDIK